jgi:hypothetical protein
VLAYTHRSLETIALLREHLRLEDLRGKVFWVGVEVLGHSEKIGGGGTGDERGAAPVVKHGSGRVVWGEWGEIVDDQLTTAEACFGLRSGGRWNEEGVLRTMLLREARLDRAGVGVECGNSGWRWIR